MSDRAASPCPAEREGRPIYRAFLLKPDGSIQSCEVIQAESDDAAKAAASRMVNGHGIDLWDRARFLGSYPPLSAKP